LLNPTKPQAGLKIRENLYGYIFIFPAVVVLGCFVLLPIVYAIFLSLNQVQLLGGIKYNFAGLHNFSYLLNDPEVGIALKNTAQYVVFVVPCQTILALICAITLNSAIWGRKLWLMTLFLPTVTSSTVLTLIFMWIYHRDGLLNHLLSLVGLPTYNWLGDPLVALKGIMIMNIWSTAPLYMVIYLAALQSISPRLYEAAELDGANAWDKFLYITIPSLRPVTFFVLAMGIIGTFQLFDQSYIFSGGTGGPNNATLTLVLLIYQAVFRNLQMGYGAAIACSLATIIIALTLIARLFFGDERM
jgi:multiple sugar transport system permease protein